MVDKNEEQIRRAIVEGYFENLPGKGKPLNLDENPFEDPEWKAANRMLQNAGFSLPWMETRKTIEADFGAAIEELSRAWRQRQSRISKGLPWTNFEGEWQRAVDAFGEKIDDLNKRIFTYNLETPNMRFHMREFSREKEVEKVKNQ
jgi:DnaJ homolog subfamily C member 28